MSPPQVLLQVLIILTGNYNFFNVLTIVLAFSLLDEEHLGRWLGRPRRRHGTGETPGPTFGWGRHLLGVLAPHPLGFRVPAWLCCPRAFPCSVPFTAMLQQ